MAGGEATVRALEELYRSRYRRFLRVATAVLGSSEAGADAVQDGFARALRGRQAFRGEGSLEGWVWRCVLSEALDVRRRSGREAAAELREVAANGRAAEHPELRAAVAALPERQRHALFLRHYAGLSYEEIAEALGVARGTVAATLHAAHASLRSRIEEVRT